MIIGIGGCSNSGKSLLAKQISDHYDRIKRISILCQDDFVKRRDFLTNIEGHVNWELPSTIEFEKYLSSVKDAEKKNDMVVCEGLFAFWFNELNALYDKKIFLDINKNTFKYRKKRDLRWGKESDWYIDHIWQSHLSYGKLNAKDDKNTLIINASQKFNLEEIIEFIDIEINTECERHSS